MLIQQAIVTVTPNQNNSTIIQILNPTIQPQFWPPSQVSDNWVTIASLIISACAFGIVIYQIHQTSKALKLTKEEMDNKLRPWVSITSIKRGGFKPYNGKDCFEYRFYYKNFGDSPAINLNKKIDWQYNKEFILDDSFDDERNISLMPGQELDEGRFIPKDEYLEITNGNRTLYVLVSFSYINSRDNTRHITKRSYQYRANVDKFFILNEKIKQI